MQIYNVVPTFLWLHVKGSNMKENHEMNYCQSAEQLVQILMKKTQNNNPLFFRVQVAYYFAKLASMMRTSIKVHGRGNIPVSLYALNLGTSGSGKGFSTNIIEEHVINKFKTKFTEDTFKTLADINLAKIATKRAAKQQEDPDEMLEKVTKEFDSLGELAFSFDSGTAPAVKQMRHKLLMANSGSVNLEIDEIGSNLLSNVEVLNTFLELFDVGKVKQKLTKNTSENVRSAEVEGRTPTNMLLFGTPAKLLNGSKTEEEFHSLLETGYARRCFFGYSNTHITNTNVTPEEVYNMMADTSDSAFLDQLSTKLGALADMLNFDVTLDVSKPVNLLIIEYKLKCEALAASYKDHEEVSKAELSHRYYKALKLAGAYAFIEGSHEITAEHFYAAVKLAEESGEAFKRILTRERNYVKLAKYIANIGKEVTHVDLMEDLPFYKGAESQRRDMLSLATAYGYKNNIIIKKSYSDSIEFLEGESMQETDLTKMIVSYSTNITEDFTADSAPFDGLHKLVTLPDYHYTAHRFKGGYRNSVNAIQGFNLVILDVENSVSLSTAKLLLKGYKALFATTKRHTDKANRFRIILPLTHTVKLDPEKYKEFMASVFDWLPFDVDSATGDIARKWCTHEGEYFYEDGDMLDALLFIPQTRKAEDQAKKVLDNQSLSNLERWFVLNTATGNRSKQLIKYALILVDSGYTYDQLKAAVIAFNDKLKQGLTLEEINKTIMVTSMKAIANRDAGT